MSKTFYIWNTQDNQCLRARSCARNSLIFADFRFLICVNVHYVFARELYFYLTQNEASTLGESIVSIMMAREVDGRISWARTSRVKSRSRIYEREKYLRELDTCVKREHRIKG